MRAQFLSFLALAVVATSAAGSAIAGEEPRVLTVCADPNNMPFSNRAEEGFENKLSTLIAQRMHARLTYVWWAQRRGYARSTLVEPVCDLWPGVALGIGRMATSRPYYRSMYVFLSRSDAPFRGLTLDDERLRSTLVAVQMIGNDATNTPPAHALARRGLTDNVRGYMLYGNYETSNPPAAIVNAVINGEVGVALVWGPVAGYFAQQATSPLRLEPVTPSVYDATWPMVFDIAVGVRKGNPELLRQVNQILAAEAPAIEALLLSYGVPLAPQDTRAGSSPGR
jgi:quinoprotein dehydrogenase-associated probable ABC transporter substrate-binding protein